MWPAATQPAAPSPSHPPTLQVCRKLGIQRWPFRSTSAKLAQHKPLQPSSPAGGFAPLQGQQASGNSELTFGVVEQPANSSGQPCPLLPPQQLQRVSPTQQHASLHQLLGALAEPPPLPAAGLPGSQGTHGSMEQLHQLVSSLQQAQQQDWQQQEQRQLSELLRQATQAPATQALPPALAAALGLGGQPSGSGTTVPGLAAAAAPEQAAQLLQLLQSRFGGAPSAPAARVQPPAAPAGSDLISLMSALAAAAGAPAPAPAPPVAAAADVAQLKEQEWQLLSLLEKLAAPAQAAQAHPSAHPEPVRPAAPHASEDSSRLLAALVFMQNAVAAGEQQHSQLQAA